MNKKDWKIQHEIEEALEELIEKYDIFIEYSWDYVEA